MLSPEWRNRLIVFGAALAAVVAGVQTAGGDLFWVAAMVVVVVLSVLAYVQPIPVSTLILGFTMAGYIVGNRGFAQLSIVGGSALLPAECALAFGLIALGFGCAFRREMPAAKDALNYAVLAWLAIGTVRFALDVRSFGFTAVRDFATVYYALFFFVAQYTARHAPSLRFLIGCVYGSVVVLLLILPFYDWEPDFFMRTLVVRGTPLIYYKGDLLTTFLAMASLLFFLRYEASGRWYALLISLGALVPVLSSDNRAALIGLWAATAFLAYGRRWRFALYQLVGGGTLAVVVLMVAVAQGRTWESTGVFKFYERVVSIVDFSGEGTYRGEETSNKGENNAFRAVWWKAAVDETIEGNPWVGLGFGHDLAARFLEKYYPTRSDDFTVRSPHNICVTVFARMGLVGLVSFLAIVFLAFRETAAAMRNAAGEDPRVPLWCGAWIVLVSACFGVVLEGPMGAVVFWVLLGLAHHLQREALSAGGATTGSLAEARPVNELPLTH